MGLRYHAGPVSSGREQVAFAQAFHIKQDMRKQLAIMVFLVLASVVQTLYYYPQLPGVVASHFNAEGTANGWQSKGAFFGIYYGVMMLIVLVFSGSTLLFDRIPDSLINLPRKDYWLAPERREETFAFINGQMMLFGNATLVFILVVFELAIRANLTSKQQLPSSIMLPLLGAYILASAVWTIRFILRFRK
jgi:uncharacterized membrane protein